MMIITSLKQGRVLRIEIVICCVALNNGRNVPVDLVIESGMDNFVRTLKKW